MYFKYFLLVLVDLFVSAMNIFLAPIVVLFADKSGWLPKWLWWFQTPGDSLYGSTGWQTKDRWFLVEDTKWKQWLNKVGWLYRNPIYGFAIDVLGIQGEETDTLVITGDVLTSNHNPIHYGSVRYELVRSGKVIAFQVYTVKPTSWYNSRYTRTNYGWKLWSFPTKEKIQFTFSPNPFRKIHK